MALTDFHARVARVVRRGAVYDLDIPQYVVDAVRTLEDLHPWRHMWRESFLQTLAATDSEITFTGTVKSVRYLRFVVPANSGPLSGRFAYAKKKQPDDIVRGKTYSSLRDASYWFRTPQIIQLDGAFATDTFYDIGWYQYSLVDDDLPWLTINQGVLLAQTLIEMHPLVRDDKMLARNSAVLAIKLAAMTESDLIHQYDGDDHEMIPHWDEMQDDLFTNNEGGLP